MKISKIKNIAFASAFVTGNFFIMVANATATNYFDGVQYTHITNGNWTLGGTYTSGASISGTVPLIAGLSEQVRFPYYPPGPTPAYISLNSGTYTLSLNISGMSGNFIDLSSGCGGGALPACPTSGVGVFYRLQGNPTSTYVNAGNAVINGTNTLNLGSLSGNYYFGISLWTTGANYILSDLVLTDGTVVQVVIPSVNLAPNAYALRSVYNIQSASMNAGLSYDCNVFDKEGFCLSTGGRYSVTNTPETSTTSGLLIGSYKYDKNIRVGAWVDQNLSTNNTDGVKLSNSKPLFGFFGAWTERPDGLGYEVKVSAGYGDKDVTITRELVNEGEAQLKSRGIQTVSSFGMALDSNWIASPYVGAKYVSIKRGGYAERGTNGLGYDAVTQETTSALAGVSLKGKIDGQTFAVVSAGAEHDFSHNVSQYAAFSGNGTVTTNTFNSKPQKTRPVVSAGVYYDIDKAQRLGLNATYRQEAFETTTSTTALATYTVGF